MGSVPMTRGEETHLLFTYVSGIAKALGLGAAAESVPDFLTDEEVPVGSTSFWASSSFLSEVGAGVAALKSIQRLRMSCKMEKTMAKKQAPRRRLKTSGSLRSSWILALRASIVEGFGWSGWIKWKRREKRDGWTRRRR